MGKTVAEINAQMSGREYVGWLKYLYRNPPGDYYTQALLARLICEFVNFAESFKKKPRSHQPHEFAPWLFPDLEDNIDRENETKEERQKRLLSYVNAARG